MFYLGVDTGGTFTDFALFDTRTRDLTTFKVRSVPSDPASAVQSGLRRLREEFAVAPASVERLIFGTTVATNAVLERKGATVALLTTRGMRDVLEIQRQWRRRLFDLYLEKPPPLAERRHRIEVDERVLASGAVLAPLTREEIERCVAAVRSLGVDAVGVCLLFSFLRPEHERALGIAIKDALPDLHVTISSDLSPEFREYERTATTVMNAYTAPKIEALLRRLGEVLRTEGFRGTFGIMQSNGGVMSLERARSHAVNTLLSGPAGGVVGAAAVAGYSNVRNVLGFDVGGTSTDIALVENGEVRLGSDGGIGGYPVKVPQVGVHTIGAGGGSIARPVLGMLKVGPRSAGANPGPACYGQGGIEPTATDAAVALGYIDPDYFVGGEIRLDLGAARTAVLEKVAAPLGLDPDEAALAILDVQVATIVAGIRKVSVEAGKDPREFALLPFGGAGGIYAGMVAEELGMRTILLPRHPSVLSALGMLLTDIRQDVVLTRIARLDALGSRDVGDAFRDLEARVAASLAREGLAPDSLEFSRSCDMRYVGQAYEINIALSDAGSEDRAFEPAILRTAFHAEHKRLYGQCSEREPVEIVSYRVGAVSVVEKAALAPIPARDRGAPQPRAHRSILLDRRAGWVACPVFERTGLAFGDRISGPAIVDDGGSTFVLRTGHALSLDRIGNIFVAVPAAARARRQTA
ncbi:MAG: hydantoinase/oxoprolinase family protein [Alphaproteobacteria bacterium]|nr:hydantoinase/oxoprolinase family protein [Alphaproteobacteria bacterium]